MVKHLTTTSGGAFSDSFNPDTPGLWSVRARWPGDTNHYSCESQPASFSVEKKPQSFWQLILGGLLPTIAIIIIIIVIAAAIVLVRRGMKRRTTETKPAARFCAKCRAEISREHDYCPQCGEKIQ